MAGIVAGKSPRGSTDLASATQHDLLKAKYPDMGPFGTGAPPTLQAAISAGRVPSLETSPLPSSVPKDTPLSPVSCMSSPILGDPADPQKLVASWVTDEHYGDAIQQVSLLA